MRICVDGVFFQIAQSGIARVWASLLPLLARQDEVEIFLLDRGGAPTIEGVTNVPYPTYHHRYTPEDSLLLQKMCDHLRIDVFTSSYYTTPLTTPMALIVYDMIPELFDYDLLLRNWMEKSLAIAYARRIVCISQSTRTDLIRFHPHTADHAVVAHPGYDEAVFSPGNRDAFALLRAKLGLDRPFYLLVGSREQHMDYKNAGLFFRAAATMGEGDFDVLCAGGEAEVNPAHLADLPRGVRVRRIVATDQELAGAYADALALVYPSLYEGFGLPVLEAMACGCPVITSDKGSLAEVAGDACLLVDGYSVPEMKAALGAVRDRETRKTLIYKGFKQAERFRWTEITGSLITALVEAQAIGATPAYAEFAGAWTRLRQLQANVDIEVMV